MDIPGFEERERSSSVLNNLLTNCKSLNRTQFHAIFFVVRAFDSQLWPSEKQVFQILPNLFTEAPAVNVIANFSDSGEPAVKTALTIENINPENIFKVNTIFVESGSSNFDELFTYMDTNNTSVALLPGRNAQKIIQKLKIKEEPSSIKRLWNRARSQSKRRPRK